MRDIKRRIKSVQSTQKITRAMKMIAATKLKRAQQRAEGSRTFFETTRSIFQNVVGAAADLSHPLLATREGDKIGYVIITADRGLAGGYNARIINEIAAKIEGSKENSSLITIGRRGRDHFAKRNYNLISEYIGIEDHPYFSTAQKIAEELIQFYESEVFDRVYLGYMRFKSALTQIPTVVPILPIEADISSDERRTEYIYEPSATEVLNWIVPKYLENIIYSALLEAKASEFGARMTAMDSATENAQEMIDKLVLSYNRARQSAITTEITEIIGGAEALK